MSELIDTRRNGQKFRRRLLATVSALAVSVYCGNPVRASGEDSDRPVLWIELGGLLDRLDDPAVPFAPPFFDTITKGGFKSPLEAGKSAIYSNGLEGAISFMPGNSDWVFSGSVSYGRSDGHRFLHQQPKAQVTHFSTLGKYITATAPPRYAQTKADNSEAHVIVDFQAGKDVGVGMFGTESTSIVSLGVRFAQFSAKSDSTIRARPDVHFAPQEVFKYHQFQVYQYHEYFGSAQRAASFQGLGPSISWNASVPLGGTEQAGKIAFNWGANAAVLFGRQKAKTHHRSTGSYFYHNGIYKVTSELPSHVGTGDRSHSAVVPNVGAFAGLSYDFPNAKVSIGYRGDFFFGAVDGGIDAAKKENVGFYGPFASISVGIP